MSSKTSCRAGGGFEKSLMLSAKPLRVGEERRGVPPSPLLRFQSERTRDFGNRVSRPLSAPTGTVNPARSGRSLAQDVLGALPGLDHRDEMGRVVDVLLIGP